MSAGDPSSPAALTHLDDAGAARMVDVGAKPATVREAVASGALVMTREALDALRGGHAPKGDALAVARVAGIMGAKRTADLVPLCHPVALTGVTVDFTFDDALPGVRATASARTTGPTGVEMEALTAVSVALLALYDMAKAIDRSMTISDVRLDAKRGGRTGEWSR